MRQDSTGTIAKETGGNLAAIKTNTDKFTFDVSGNLLTAGGAAASTVGITDTTGAEINPATDESSTLLRRMVKLMETQSAFDLGNRQRVTLDAMTSGLTLSTVSTVSAVTSMTNLVAIAGQNQQMYQDPARNTFANGIRRNLLN